MLAFGERAEILRIATISSTNKKVNGGPQGAEIP